ncbi:MAG: TetR/AcrR family transcriptional regulator [Flavobacteriaceae bacterium]|nr:TetR/AcrR family transcriptional regulator [Flavobacteriaceae bacterium]
MQEKILNTAIEEFLTNGFKSVTMDDIATKLAISKKTIYIYYKNKTTLVEATVMAVFDKINLGIDCICALEKNAIEELFNIKEFVIENLNGEKNSPQYQLKKYYPLLFAKLHSMQFEVIQKCVSENIIRGIKSGIYRKEVDIDFITRIYFSGIIAIKDIDLFPLGKNNMKLMLEFFLDYHIRAIATVKGVKKLNQLLK